MSAPRKIFKFGKVRVSVFVNQMLLDGQRVAFPKVAIQVRFLDRRTGCWRSTTTLSLNDLPKCIAGLQRAYEYLLSGEYTAEAGKDESPPD